MSPRETGFLLGYPFVTFGTNLLKSVGLGNSNGSANNPIGDSVNTRGKSSILLKEFVTHTQTTGISPLMNSIKFTTNK
jgi:hypothetical protein